MGENCQQVIKILGIDIELFFKRLDTGLNRGKLSNHDQEIICQCLLGHSRQYIAAELHLPAQTIRDRLCQHIYPKIAELMQVEQDEIAGNWVRIINLLCKSYKLIPPPELNRDDFQGSFGRQIFLHPRNQVIAELQTQATQLYCQGLYYQAFHCFLKAWEQEQENYRIGNPEILIYINNCLIEREKSRLEENDITVYKLAVVVPFHHNEGRVATETLRGVAQIQLQANLQSLGIDYLRKTKFLDAIIPDSFSHVKNISCKHVLQILIVNDPNKLYEPYNQTAENLANLTAELNLIAILGHYSSEMTKRAIKFYTKKGLLLLNSSSTSSELSSLPESEKLCFFRLTTQDNINAKQLVNYLLENFAIKGCVKVAIIYNSNSSYSTSYRNVIKQYIAQQEQFILLPECNYLSQDYYKIKSYIETVQQEKVDIIIVIPDGGIEPNSLYNTALISRLNLANCLIAGSATFYQENVLHWLHDETYSERGKIISCIPWHWDSQKNGCNSPNSLAQYFCRVGTQLWGEGNLTWRSATAFDSILLILRVLERHHRQNNQQLLSQSLLEHMDQYLKQQQNIEIGVTGKIQFNQNGDRIAPPAEIVSVEWSQQKQRWTWKHLKSM